VRQWRYEQQGTVGVMRDAAHNAAKHHSRHLQSMHLVC